MPDPRKLLYVSPRPCPSALLEPLTERGWQVIPARDLTAAHRLLRTQGFLVALAVLGPMAGDLASEFEYCMSADPRCEWVALVRPGTAGSAPMRALLRHFFDHHTEPVQADFLCRSIGHAYGRARLADEGSAEPSSADDLDMVGSSEVMARLRRMVRKAAAADAPVLISGESGSGKELVAKALHGCSARSGGPFVAVNCGAIAPTLFHSEVFGHERGAFSGASSAHQGLIESARGGTLFLDEIAELPLDLQATLLRFLQEKTIQRLGAAQFRLADTRVIAASHVDLPQAVAAGRFREDVYYRLSVLTLPVPSLKERQQDIPLLAKHFLDRASRLGPTSVRGFSSEGMAALLAHSWPGNVRELYNRVQRAVLMSELRLLAPSDLGLDQEEAVDWGGLQDSRVKAEKNAICFSLQRVSHNVTLAARDLGISRMTLYRLMAKHSIARRVDA